MDCAAAKRQMPNMASTGAINNPTAFGYEYQEVTRSGRALAHGSGKKFPVKRWYQAKRLIAMTVAPSAPTRCHLASRFLKVTTIITNTINGSTKYARHRPSAASGFGEYTLATKETKSHKMIGRIYG